MILLFAVLIVLLVVAIASAVYFGPRMLLMPKRRPPEFYLQRYGFSHPSQIGLDYVEETLITSERHDSQSKDLRLKYWVIENTDFEEGAGVVIYLHGITDSKVSGLNYARALIRTDPSGRRPCNKVYLIDMRRHGDSEGDYCTYGYFEKYDVAALIDKIESKHHGAEITLLGVSMGAAIAIQTAAIDNRVSRVIAVAPFYDLFSIALDHQVHKIGIKSKLLLKLVLARAERIAGFEAPKVSPAIDIPKIHVPILIVHGTEDKTVKSEYSLRLKELNENAQLLVVPNAGHIDVLERGGKAYLEKLVEFIKKT